MPLAECRFEADGAVRRYCPRRKVVLCSSAFFQTTLCPMPIAISFKFNKPIAKNTHTLICAPLRAMPILPPKLRPTHLSTICCSASCAAPATAPSSAWVEFITPSRFAATTARSSIFGTALKKSLPKSIATDFILFAAFSSFLMFSASRVSVSDSRLTNLLTSYFCHITYPPSKTRFHRPGSLSKTQPANCSRLCSRQRLSPHRRSTSRL